LAPAKEQESVTAHTIVAGGRTLDYHATAGAVTIRDDDAKPEASVFYVAYTLDGAAPGTRPVTFFYNGGPGSSSVWLHMGSFAPVRVKTANPEFIRPAPYGFGPNPDTLLDKTDLVFVDMVGAGYSRPLGDAKGKQFWGVDACSDLLVPLAGTGTAFQLDQDQRNAFALSLIQVSVQDQSRVAIAWGGAPPRHLRARPQRSRSAPAAFRRCGAARASGRCS
jgi:hypothetical protein